MPGQQVLHNCTDDQSFVELVPKLSQACVDCLFAHPWPLEVTTTQFNCKIFEAQNRKVTESGLGHDPPTIIHHRAQDLAGWLPHISKTEEVNLSTTRLKLLPTHKNSPSDFLHPPPIKKHSCPKNINKNVSSEINLPGQPKEFQEIEESF